MSNTLLDSVSSYYGKNTNKDTANEQKYEIEYLYFIPYDKIVKEHNTTYTYPHYECFLGNNEDINKCTKLIQLTGSEAQSVYKRNSNKLKLLIFSETQAKKLLLPNNMTLSEIEKELKKANKTNKKTGKEQVINSTKKELEIQKAELCELEHKHDSRNNELEQLTQSIILDEIKIKKEKDALIANEHSLQFQEQQAQNHPANFKKGDQIAEYENFKKATNDKIDGDQEKINHKNAEKEKLANVIQKLKSEIENRRNSIKLQERELKIFANPLPLNIILSPTKYNSEYIFIGKRENTVLIDNREVTYSHQDYFLGDDTDLDKCTQFTQLTGSMANLNYQTNMTNMSLKDVLSHKGLEISELQKTEKWSSMDAETLEDLIFEENKQSLQEAYLVEYTKSF